MRKYLLILAAFAIFAAGCTDAAPPVSVSNAPNSANRASANTPAPANRPAATQPAAGHEDDGHDAPRINLADAKKDFDAGNAFFVDVRDATAYETEHITGAANISKATLEANLNKIPKGKKIIAYCS